MRIASGIAMIALLTASAAGAAPPAMHSVGIFRDAPKRMGVLVDVNAVRPGLGGALQVMEYVFLETPIPTDPGVTVAAIVYSKNVNCISRNVSTNYIEYLRDDGSVINREEGNSGAAGPVAEGSADGKILAAACSSNWSALPSVPVESVSATRARMFGS